MIARGADVRLIVGWLRNATDSYCGTVDTPAHSIYASINATFYSIRELAILVQAVIIWEHYLTAVQ